MQEGWGKRWSTRRMEVGCQANRRVVTSEGTLLHSGVWCGQQVWNGMPECKGRHRGAAESEQCGSSPAEQFGSAYRGIITQSRIQLRIMMAANGCHHDLRQRVKVLDI